MLFKEETAKILETMEKDEKKKEEEVVQREKSKLQEV